MTRIPEPLRPEEPVFASAARLYLEGGLGFPIPLPPRRKAPPPRGYTGAEARDVSVGQINRWSRSRRPTSNIGLRMAPGLIGVDVDAYDSNAGRTRLTGSSSWTALCRLLSARRAAPTASAACTCSGFPQGCRGGATRSPSRTTARRPPRGLDQRRLPLCSCAGPRSTPNGGRYQWFGPGMKGCHVGASGSLDGSDLPAAWVTGSPMHRAGDARCPRARFSQQIGTPAPGASTGLISRTKATFGGRSHSAVLQLQQDRVARAPEGQRNSVLFAAAAALAACPSLLRTRSRRRCFPLPSAPAYPSQRADEPSGAASTADGTGGYLMKEERRSRNEYRDTSGIRVCAQPTSSSCSR